MFSGLTYFFDHSIYFARLCHVNPLCKHEYAFLQMKEAPNQKVQEKKPLLKFKNTKKYMCLERIWRKKCFWACRHRPLLVRGRCNEESGEIGRKLLSPQMQGKSPRCQARTPDAIQEQRIWLACIQVL